MRHIVLNASDDFNELEVVKAIVGSAPEGGYTIDQVRKAIRVSDALERGQEVLLEDADWSFLCDRVQKVPWLVAKRAVVDLIDKVINAPPYTAPPSVPAHVIDLTHT